MNSTALVPVPAAEGRTLTEVCAGNGYTCGLDEAGRTLCWGAVPCTCPAGLPSPVGLACPVDLPSQYCAAPAACRCLNVCTHTHPAACPVSLEPAAGDSEMGLEAPPASPAELPGNHTFQSISCGRFHACGLEPPPSSKAYCWGVSVGARRIQQRADSRAPICRHSTAGAQGAAFMPLLPLRWQLRAR